MTERQTDVHAASLPLMTFHDSRGNMDDTEDEEDPLEGVLNRMKYRSQLHHPHDFWPSVLLSGGLCLVTGFIVSYVIFVVGQRSLAQHQQVVTNVDYSFGTQFSKLLSEDQLSIYISDLNQEGSGGAFGHIHKHFISQGFDNSYLFNHTILCAISNPQHSSKVSIVDKSGDHFSASVNVSSTLTGFNDIEILGQMVYIGNGLAEDWLSLEKENVTIAGQIIVASVGKLWPENIADASYQRGAAAVLLYSAHQPYFPFWFPQFVSPGIGGLYQANQGFRLPVASLGSKDAEVLLRMSLSNVEKEGWIEGVPGMARHGTLRLQLHVENHIDPVHNVLAVLGGREEPDRYVVIGAHRSNSLNGTAALMELARLFGKLKVSKGWRPRRTLVLASWGGEGSSGAATWLSQFKASVKARTVAYIDIHELISVSDYALVQSSPLLRQVLSEVAAHEPGLPYMDLSSDLPIPGPRSGCPPFIHNAATSCLSLRFSNISSLVVSVRLAGLAGWLLAESAMLPFDVTSLTSALTHCLDNLHSSYDTMLKQHNFSLRMLDEALQMLTQAAGRFKQHLDVTTIHTTVQLRELNDQMRQLAGTLCVPNDSDTRDVYAWPSSVADFGLGFGPLQDMLVLCSSMNHDSDHKLELQLQKHTEELSHFLQSAAKLLLPPTQLL